MKKSLYILPAVLLFGVTTAGAQTANRPETQRPQSPSANQASPSAKNATAITTASAVASAKDDQKVQLRGKIVGKQGKGNEYMFRDGSGQVLVEIGSRAVKGSNKQLAAGTEVEIQGEVDVRKGKSPKVEAKQVTVLAAAGGMSGGPSGSPSAPQRSQSPSSPSGGGKY